MTTPNVPLETIQSRAAAVADRLIAEAGCYRPLTWVVRALQAAYITGRRDECRDKITGTSVGKPTPSAPSFGCASER